MNGIGWWVGAGIIIIQLVVVSFLIRNYVSIFDPTITLSDFLSAVSWIIGFVGIFYYIGRQHKHL